MSIAVFACSVVKHILGLIIYWYIAMDVQHAFEERDMGGPIFAERRTVRSPGRPPRLVFLKPIPGTGVFRFRVSRFDVSYNNIMQDVRIF